MTDTELALLRAICEEPDEDTPRLVFADYLDEEGGRVNATWAEFIRVQIALDRDPASARHLRPRERDLEWPTGVAWTARMGLPEVGQWGSWHRGFPQWYSSSYHYPLSELRPERRAIAAFERALPAPVREVRIAEWTAAEFRSFLKWPGVLAVRELTLERPPHPFAEGVLALAACEHASGLETLGVARLDVTDEVALAVLDSPHLTRLRGFWAAGEDLIAPAAVRARFDARFPGWRLPPGD